MQEPSASADAPDGAADPLPSPSGGGHAAHSSARGPGSLDGVTSFMGMRWDDPQTVRLQIRPELINAGGLL
ncbi:MAG: hypothetical protein M3Z95_03480, partial [Actinomycetota bacterium]|nr:hypothetical protein [Actinomycetota bacterium]